MRAYRVLTLLLIVATGCSRSGPSPTDPAYDSDQARSTLTSALDAWKKGEAKALTRRNPPIRFVDDDLAAGLRLNDFEIQDPHGPIALHQDVPVSLSLRDRRGKVINREVHYQIALSPGLAVLRSDH